jgi:hypothetical protein
LDEILAEIWLDEDHRVLLRLVEWQGNLRFDVGVHFRVGHQWLPTRRGAAIPVSELDAVRAAVESAMASAGGSSATASTPAPLE